MSMRGQSTALDWEEDDVLGPDVTRRETLLLLAKMTNDAYFAPFASGWYNLTDEWNVVRGPAPFCVFVRVGENGELTSFFFM